MMKYIIFLTVLLSQICIAEPSVPLHEKMVGRWQGKWDNKFGVEFSITKTNFNSYEVEYYVEENKGKPYVESKISGQVLNDNSIMASPIYFIVNKEDAVSVTAVGIFDTGTRIAVLTKLKN